MIGLAIAAIVFVATGGHVLFLPLLFLPFLFMGGGRRRHRGAMYRTWPRRRTSSW
ncbi:MAG TPA: hypothetical protein VD931_11025 [Baekduia sp.]|nr:hypothetical protein [Baekduia sp.]